MMHLLSRIVLVVAMTTFVLGPAAPVLFAQDAAEKSEHKEGEHGDKEGGQNQKDGEHDDGKSHSDKGDHVSHDMPPLLSMNVGSAVCNIAIFLGVFAILSKFVWPPILGGLKAREDKISSDLEGAEKANLEAQGLLSEYQAKLDDAATQVQTMLAEARRDAEAAGARIVEEAKAEAQRQSDRAIADIETAKKVALSDIAGQTSSMAISVAKQVVGRELKESDHADLIRQSLDRLPSNN